jgi:hypothetical protein
MIDTIEMIGLKRSGHHAVMNWVVKNLVHQEVDYWYKYIRLGDTSFWILNDGSHKIEDGGKMFLDEIDNSGITPNTFIVNYEDTDTNYCLFNNEKIYKGSNNKYEFYGHDIKLNSRVLIIRNFYDNIFSRYLGVKNRIVIEAFYDDRFINLWKKQAKFYLKNKENCIKLEDWINNENKRKEFLKYNFNINETFNSDNIRGTTSSNTKNIEKDYKILPNKIKELIRKDNELHNLIGKLGYDYKEL